MERSREVSRIGRVQQKPPAARTLPELALVVAELAKVALVAEASPELQQDVAAVARLVVLEEAQALRLPQDCKGGAALVYVSSWCLHVERCILALVQCSLSVSSPVCSVPCMGLLGVTLLL
jgi:hypothetical protein